MGYSEGQDEISRNIFLEGCSSESLTTRKDGRISKHPSGLSVRNSSFRNGGETTEIAQD